MAQDRKGRLQEFADWAAAHIKGDEKLQSPRPFWERVRVRAIDRLFQAFGQKGLLEVGGTAEFRIRKAKEDGGGTAFADYVWKPLVLIEMKKRGTDLRSTYRQAFDYWTRLFHGYAFSREAFRQFGLQDSHLSPMIYVCVPYRVLAKVRLRALH